MKIIDARTGQLQTIPFNLGEKGRGRWLEEVKVSNRPGQEPSGPEDVSYFVFGQDRKHCILTKANPGQRGILLRINTAGVYTKGSCGATTLKGGKATLLTEGSWAEGDAGRVADGPDQLWHVEEPSVFVVTLQGGEWKGMGHRYLFVTKSLRTVMIRRAELCQLIATDEDPEVAEVVREYVDRVAVAVRAAEAKVAEASDDASKAAAEAELKAAKDNDLHVDVKEALKLAAELDDSEKPVATVAHFFSYRPMEQVVADHGFAVPMSLRLTDGNIGGVSGIQTGTLVPGDKALVAFSIGRMGGKRYGVQIEAEVGLTRLHVSEDYRGNQGEVLALVEQPDWHVVLRHFKDGEEHSVVRYDAGGEHRCDPTGKVYQTIPWTGREPVAPPVPG